MEEVRGCVPFIGTPLDILGVSDGVSTSLTVTLEEVASEGEEKLGGEEDLDNSVSDDLVLPVRTGGGGARYLTLVDCDCGESGCDGGGDCVFGGTVVGTGGAGDLKDLGLEDRGGLDGSPEA